MDKPLVYIVTPVFNNIVLTLRFLASLAGITYANYRIVIVDDGSSDGTESTIRENYPDVLILKGTGSLWWAGATNQGIRYALENCAEYILTINNDALVNDDFLDQLVKTALENGNAIIGCRIMHLEDPSKIWSMGGGFDWDTLPVLRLIRSGEYIDSTDEEIRCEVVRFLCGNGTLLPAMCFRKLGFYDESRFPQYHADSEYCLRAGDNGYKILIDSNAVIFNDTRNIGSKKKNSLWNILFSRQSYLNIKGHFHFLKYASPTDKGFTHHLGYKLFLQYLAYALKFYPKKCYKLLRKSISVVKV